MPHKDPDTYNTIQSLMIPLWAYVLAFGGAIVHSARKLREGSKFSIKEFIADTVISLSIGYTTYFICQTQGLTFEWTVVAISLSSGMGNKYYDKIEDVIGGVLAKWLTIKR